MDLTLSFGGVSFRLSASTQSSSTRGQSSSPIVSVNEIRDPGSYFNDGRTPSGIIAELSNFTGTLKISIDNEKKELYPEPDWNEVLDVLPKVKEDSREEKRPEVDDDEDPVDYNWGDGIASNDSKVTSNKHGHSFHETDKESLQRTVLIVDPSSLQNEGTSRTDSDGSDINLSYSTSLHKACANIKSCPKELLSLLKSDPSAASARDDSDQFPIHIALQNEYLVSQIEEADEFWKEMIKANPDALLIEDINGDVPFTSFVKEWINIVHSNVHAERETKIYKPRSYFDNYLQVASGDTNKTRQPMYLFPQNVDININCEWSLNMLSYAIERLKGPADLKSRSPSQPSFLGESMISIASKVVASDLASKIASIPFFVKTILLIENDDIRQRIMDLPIFRRVIYCPESVDQWLVFMIRRKQFSPRVIDYFELLSKMTVRQFIGPDKTLRPSDHEFFFRCRKRVFNEIHKYGGIIPSLMVTRGCDIERASTTDVIFGLLDRTISRPFIISVVMIDLVCTVFLMIIYRSQAFSHGVLHKLEVNNEWELYFPSKQVTDQTVYIITIHFILRKVGDYIALMNISPKVFLAAFFNFWNMIQVVMIICVLFTSTQIDEKQEATALFAFTMGLLWLSLIGFLKAVNSQLATYILAIKQILKDLMWFLIFLVCVLFGYADVMHILRVNNDIDQMEDICVKDVSGPDQKLKIENWDSEEVFCSPVLLKSYIQTTSYMLGDFSLDEFSDSTMMIIIALFFSVFIIVVVLNVLIALVIEAYEKTQVKSEKLFGKSRLELAAEHSSLEKYLHPWPMPDNGKLRWLCHRILQLSIMASLIVTPFAASITIFLMTQKIMESDNKEQAYKANIWFLITIVIILTTVLYLAVLNMMKFAWKNFLSPEFIARIDETQVAKNIEKVLSRIFNSAVRAIGINPERDISEEDDEDEIERKEWGGRLDHLEQMTNRIVTESELRMSKHMLLNAKHIERQIAENDAAIKSDLTCEIRTLISLIMDMRSVDNYSQAGVTSRYGRQNIFDGDIEEVEASNRFLRL